MGRIRRDFKRLTNFRDANLIVVATEGEKCEPLYFESLKNSDLFPNPKVHVEIIPSQEGKTSPKHVLNKLNEFKSEFRIREDDELWMVIDRDYRSWTQAELSQCLTECNQKKFKLCISNPNFELWVLLHFVCIYSQNLKYKEELILNPKENGRTLIEKLIIEKRGHYNKSNPQFDDIILHTEVAMQNAIKLSKKNTNNLFDELGTDINLLVSQIINAI